MATTVNKPAAEWTNEELIGWAKDEIKAGGQASDRTVAKAAVEKFGLEATEDTAQVKQQILAEQAASETKTEEPAPEAKEAAPAEETPKEEPKVEVKKEEPAKTTKASAKTQPKVEPKVAPQGQPLQQKPAAAAAVKKVSTAEEQKSLNRQAIEAALAQYAEVMAPGVAHGGNEGVMAQTQLFRTIQNILRQEGNEFTACFGLLLTFANQHRKTLFNERYLYRYFDAIKISAPDRKNFERFLNLIITTCDPSTRHHTIKQIDLPATLKGFNDSNVQQRVMAFYNL